MNNYKEFIKGDLMRFSSKIILGICLVAASGCKHFQELALDDSNQIALEEPVEIGLPANEYNGGMLYDFKGPINFWVANDQLSVSKVGDTMKVDIRNAGQKYECWGGELPELLDFSKAPVLKVTARCEGGTIPMLGISLKDMEGTDTNLDRPSQRIRKGNNYEEYYFNFEGKWKQIWPARAEVNPTNISDILFFVNPGQMNWTGTIYIDDIRVITLDEMPSEEEIKRRRREERMKRQQQQEQAEEPKSEVPEKPEEPAATSEDTEPKTESPAVEYVAPGKPEKEQVTEKPEEQIAGTSTPFVIQKDAQAVTIDDFSAGKNDWWTSNKQKITFANESDKMIVELKGVGPAFETFGTVFPNIDFTKTPVVRVRFKAEGDQVGDLRLDIKDAEGFSTNSKPNVKVFNSGTEFVDFYYDFTGKFEQTYPDVQRVNPSNIIEVVFFVNPGGKPYNGKLVLDEITAISLEQFNKIKK